MTTIAELKDWSEKLPDQVEQALHLSQHGNLEEWLQALDTLPYLESSSKDFQNGVTIGNPEDCSKIDQEKLENILRSLHPWRKGPFSLYGIKIDTEWRSDWKWERLKPHISSLEKKVVLDVGCGNGYHCWRMIGEKAKLVIGIDPTLVYVMQFQAIAHLAGKTNAYVLPLPLEKIPLSLKAFDTVFSMGILYHRRSPFDHLLDLRSCLKPGGELILETLVIEGGPGEVLVPEKRYAKMRNVWFLPSCRSLEQWLKRCGYKDIRLVDVSATTILEQRSTNWMTFESLPNFLQPDNPQLTVEGYPAPLRAVFIAKAPS